VGFVALGLVFFRRLPGGELLPVEVGDGWGAAGTLISIGCTVADVIITGLLDKSRSSS
jgi:hypothetical protein